MNANYIIESVERSHAGITVTVCAAHNPEEKSTFFMSGELWKETKCKTGDTISEATFEDIQNREVLSRAISRALKILSGSDQSALQLKKKLQSFEFPEDAIEKAVQYVVDHNYIDENRQTLHLAEYFVRHKFWGRKRIAAELLMRGYKKDAIIYATTQIMNTTYMKALHALMDRKYMMIESEDDKNKLFASLCRFGYSLSEINQAIRELESPDLDLEISEV